MDKNFSFGLNLFLTNKNMNRIAKERTFSKGSIDDSVYENMFLIRVYAGLWGDLNYDLNFAFRLCEKIKKENLAPREKRKKKGFLLCSSSSSSPSSSSSSFYACMQNVLFDVEVFSSSFFSCFF